MKLLLDTNIIVDVISARDGFEESLDVLKFCEVKKVDEVVSTATILDVMYILRKFINPEKVREAVQTLLTIVSVEEIKKSDIIGAFDCDMDDYEDAVQAQCAKRCGADYIVTRNIRDFNRSPVPAILPAAALELLK